VTSKRKLLVILGAGSSIPCGMPSVPEIDYMMKKWGHEWTQTPYLPIDAGNVFNDLWDIAEDYYRRHLRQHLGIHVNFERVLAEMSALASWVTPSPFGNVLSQAVRDPGLSQRFTWSSTPRPDEPFLHQRVIVDQLTCLLQKLAQHMRNMSKTLHKETPQFTKYKTILSRLRDEFEVGIYNLNYENVAVSAWPTAFTGFRDGEFDPRGIGTRREWEFICHLHGSVHYSFTEEPPFSRVLIWKDDLNSTFVDSAQMLSMGEAFKSIVPTTLLAGGFKLDQLLADPFSVIRRHATPPSSGWCRGLRAGRRSRGSVRPARATIGLIDTN
jgi:hypothetical protein